MLVDLAERRHPVALMPSPPAGPAQIDLKDGTNSSSGNPTQSVNTDESPAGRCVQVRGRGKALPLQGRPGQIRCKHNARCAGSAEYLPPN